MREATTANSATDASPAARFRSALKKYDAAMLSVVAESLELIDARKSTKLAERITDALSEPKQAERQFQMLPQPARLALALFALPELHSIASDDLTRALRFLGIDPLPALDAAVRRGLIALEADPGQSQYLLPVEALLSVDSYKFTAFIHPTAIGAVRTPMPEVVLPEVEGTVRQKRRSDGLEFLLRLGAVWQRLEEGPLRRTQSGAFFKRDRERLEDDSAIVGPISDAIEPMPDQAYLWVALGEAVGMAVADATEEKIAAAPPEYWSDNAVHLPQMLASRWLGLKTWHELGGSRLESGGPELTTISLRLPLLLILAAAPGEGWAGIDDLVELLSRARPEWGREVWPLRGPTNQSIERQLVEAVLLGVGYQLGLIEAGEEAPSGRRVVRLTEQGRYALAIGNPPEPPAVYENFLFVQPNFEMIAYRQGLTPSIIGRFSRFARWSKLGAAIELKLTAESVYRGLEGGLTTDTMLALLNRHSSRPLPPGIAEALKTWSGRRDRVTYHAGATLIEFASPEDLEAALKDWPAGQTAPQCVAPRLLLVEDVSVIPFQRFRQAGARDYRKPAEPCVEVGPDGVSISVDLGRSDLLVDAELARFSDELPTIRDGYVARRRFQVTRESIARGIEAGVTPTQLGRWFIERAGVAMPASIRLMMHAAIPQGKPIEVDRPRILTAPTEELLEGLLQHPATRDAFLERIGPRHATILEEHWPELRRALEDLGLPTSFSVS